MLKVWYLALASGPSADLFKWWLQDAKYSRLSGGGGGGGGGALDLNNRNT